MDPRRESHLRRNIKLYYLLTVATNLWFIASNWLYFWRRFMSFGQLGLVDGIGFGFSLILDVPTGAFADIFGKKITLIISSLLSFVGILIIAMGNSLGQIFLGNMILQVGWAMYSGASDALVYDSLVDLKREGEYTEISTKANQYMAHAASFAYFTGGLLYALHWRLPHYIWAFSYIFAFGVCLFITEPHYEKQHFTFQSYFQKIHLGMKELWLPQLRKYMILIFVLLGVYFLYTWGFVRPALATSFGFYAHEQSIILPILTLSTAYLVRFIPAIRTKIANFVGLSLLALILAAGFGMAAFPIGYWGIIPMFLIALVGRFSYPWVSIIINKEISSKYRATTLSTISLLSKIPYVFVAILIGEAADKNMLPQFNMVVAGTILAATFASGFLMMRKKKLSPVNS